MHTAWVLCVFWAHTSDFVTSRPFLMRLLWSVFWLTFTGTQTIPDASEKDVTSRNQNSSIKQWRMVVLLLDRRRLWCHNMTSYSRLQTNVCWHNMHVQGCRSSGRAGWAVKEFRAMETYKQQKNRYQLCLFLFINNVDLKNNNRNYRKSFLIFWLPE